MIERKRSIGIVLGWTNPEPLIRFYGTPGARERMHEEFLKYMSAAKALTQASGMQASETNEQAQPFMDNNKDAD